MIARDLGFVLRRYNFRETSVIASIYTRKFGKITGILKGFYTPKKEFASPLQACTLHEFVFYPKKREIWLVSFAELVRDFPYLRVSLPRARVAAACINIVERTMQLWDDNQAVFSLLEDSLIALGKEDERKVLSIFLIKFLTVSGFKPEFTKCICCYGSFAGTFFFSVSRGGLLCPSCRAHAPDSRKLSREASLSLLYIQNNDFPHVTRLHPTSSCAKEMFQVLRGFLAYHLDMDVLPQ
ncbi:MAG: DNA repair protein RecO [Candidatus Omnitrophota bacterium]